MGETEARHRDEINYEATTVNTNYKSVAFVVLTVALNRKHDINEPYILLNKELFLSRQRIYIGNAQTAVILENSI
jgi:hypothetical protein